MDIKMIFDKFGIHLVLLPIPRLEGDDPSMNKLAYKYSVHLAVTKLTKLAEPSNTKADLGAELVIFCF
jgi:hypothetical protein